MRRGTDGVLTKIAPVPASVSERFIDAMKAKDRTVVRKKLVEVVATLQKSLATVLKKA